MVNHVFPPIMWAVDEGDTGGLKLSMHSCPGRALGLFRNVKVRSEFGYTSVLKSEFAHIVSQLVV